MIELQVEQGDQVSGWIEVCCYENHVLLPLAIPFNGVDLMTVFGNQEECYLPWANGYRLGSIRWNREIINHEINGIMYPEINSSYVTFRTSVPIHRPEKPFQRVPVED